MSNATYDIIVIGAGVTGLIAAKSVVQNGHSTANIESVTFGGLVINVNELDPALAGASQLGAEFALNLMMEISDLGVANLSETVTGVERDGDAIAVRTDAGAYCAKAVIVASGAKLKPLGIPGETEFRGRGVSQCADCDGPMFKEEEVVVVGGGDSALQEALVLANYCKRVHIVHRGDRFRAQQHFIDQVTARNNIRPVWNSTVTEVHGAQMVTRVTLRNADGTTTDLPCAGFFAYIGLEPNSEFLPSSVERDQRGFVVTDANLQTNVKGLYAAGAVRAGFGGMLGDADEDARKAARAAATFMTSGN